MLREALEYLTTPCPPLARRHRYLTEMIALGARHRRQRRAWEPHVACCHRFIRDAVLWGPKGGRALVAGSGRLIEVPLPLLAERFDEVVLADMLHVRSVRREARRFANVRLATLDLTGALAPLDAAMAATMNGGLSPPRPDPPALAGGGFAFAVSCNLLSQLPILPLEMIDRRAPGTPEAVRLDFARSLVRSHLEWLARTARTSALFTDTESLWMESGRVAEREDSLWGLTLPAPDRRWIWDIAPAPEADSRRDLRHAVGAWFDVGSIAASL